MYLEKLCEQLQEDIISYNDSTRYGSSSLNNTKQAWNKEYISILGLVQKISCTEVAEVKQQSSF